MTLAELIQYMEHKTGATINVDARHAAFYSESALALRPEQHIHHGEFCAFAKRNSRGQEHSCFRNKERSRRIACLGRMFHGNCPFGVWELACPVLHSGKLAATLYLGHFSSGRLKAKIGMADYHGPALPKPNLPLLRHHALFLAEFIQVELDLWTAQGQATGKRKPTDFYRDFCLQYIERNYPENIQLPDLARALNVRPNYLSQILRRASGKTFSQLLSEKRLEVARTYLEFHREDSITDIAYMCGFRDSNYFSTVFRKAFGCAPRQYREQINSKILTR